MSCRQSLGAGSLPAALLEQEAVLSVGFPRVVAPVASASLAAASLAVRRVDAAGVLLGSVFGLAESPDGPEPEHAVSERAAMAREQSRAEHRSSHRVPEGQARPVQRAA